MTDERRQNTFDEMIEVIKASKRGEKTEARFIKKTPTTEFWGSAVYREAFNFYDWQYRIAKRPPSINWDHVAPWVVAVARDRFGDHWVFDLVPLLGPSNMWVKYTRTYKIKPEVFASYDPGTVDWTESLIVRPGHQEERS